MMEEELPQLWCVCICNAFSTSYCVPDRLRAEEWCMHENLRQEEIDVRLPPTDDHPSVRYEVREWKAGRQQHDRHWKQDWERLTGEKWGATK
jgi:hypothetical protein